MKLLDRLAYYVVWGYVSSFLAHKLWANSSSTWIEETNTTSFPLILTCGFWSHEDENFLKNLLAKKKM